MTEIQLRNIAPRDWSAELSNLRETPAVTLVGASERTHAVKLVLESLSSGRTAFRGKVHIVNPKANTVFGRVAVPSIDQIDGEPGLLWLFVSANLVRPILTGLKQKPRGVVVYAAGFREVGNTEDELALAAWANENGVPLFGPQSVGLAFFGTPFSTLDVALKHEVSPGDVCVISQSGGVLSAMLGALSSQSIGLSAAFALGNGAVLDFTEVGCAMLADDDTACLAVYAESFRSLSAFASLAAAGLAKGKPIVLLKGGISREGQRAAASHTGAMATANRLVEGIAEQYGVILVRDVDEMVVAVQTLQGQRYRTAGSGRIGLFSNYGGANVLLSDALASRGVPLQRPTDRTRAALLPLGSEAAGNPYDASGGFLGQPEEFDRRADIFVSDTQFDIVAYALTQVPSDTHKAHHARAESFRRRARDFGKASTVIALFNSPEPVDGEGMVACGVSQATTQLLTLQRWSAAAAQASSAPPLRFAPGSRAVRVATAREAIDLLGRLPVRWPRESTLAIGAAVRPVIADLGLPLVAKAETGQNHRASGGGVILDLESDVMVEQAVNYLRQRFGAAVTLSQLVPHDSAFFLGASRNDDGLGVLAVGPGGHLVEDRVHFRILPITRAALVALFMRLFPALEQVEALADTAVELCRALVSTDAAAIDLNPLVIDGDGRLTVLDAKLHLPH